MLLDDAWNLSSDLAVSKLMGIPGGLNVYGCANRGYPKVLIDLKRSVKKYAI